jgi:hypothetical protein
MPSLTRVFLRTIWPISALQPLAGAAATLKSIRARESGVADLRLCDVGDGTQLRLLAQLPLVTKIFLRTDSWPIAWLQHIPAAQITSIDSLEDGVADLRECELGDDGSGLTLLARFSHITKVFFQQWWPPSILEHLAAVPQLTSIHDRADGVANLSSCEPDSDSDGTELAHLPPRFTKIVMPDEWPVAWLHQLAAMPHLSSIDNRATMPDGVADMNRCALDDDDDDDQSALELLAQLPLITHVALPRSVSDEVVNRLRELRSDWIVTKGKYKQ